MSLISGGGGGGGSTFNGGTITTPLEVQQGYSEAESFGSGNPLDGGFPNFKVNGDGDGVTIRQSDDSSRARLSVLGGALGGSAIVGAGSTSNQSIFAAGCTGQTAALLELRDQNGNTVCKVGAAGGLAANPIASGALPTVAPVSGTAFQCSTTRDVYLTVPFTGDATNNAATCKVEVSPDNVTFSTLNTVSIAAALNLTGAIDLSVDCIVPAGWRVKLTATHGTLGTGTYY